MTIEEIPSDQIVIMNDYWHRAFNSAGCNPECHCCNMAIKVGMGFRLATVEQHGWKTNQVHNEDGTTEVMLCGLCTADTYAKKLAKYRDDVHKEVVRTGGCFRVNGKIIH